MKGFFSELSAVFEASFAMVLKFDVQLTDWRSNFCVGFFGFRILWKKLNGW
jgi:hypothetical protein